MILNTILGNELVKMFPKFLTVPVTAWTVLVLVEATWFPTVFTVLSRFLTVPLTNEFTLLTKGLTTFLLIFVKVLPKSLTVSETPVWRSFGNFPRSLTIGLITFSTVPCTIFPTESTSGLGSGNITVAWNESSGRPSIHDDWTFSFKNKFMVELELV